MPFDKMFLGFLPPISVSPVVKDFKSRFSGLSVRQAHTRWTYQNIEHVPGCFDTNTPANSPSSALTLFTANSMSPDKRRKFKWKG